MNEKLRAALVIARRDYVASVWSKTFLLFLIGPLFPILFGVIFGAVGAQVDRDSIHPTVAVITGGYEGRAMLESRALLARRLGGTALPDLIIVAPDGETKAQTARLLADPKARYVAVLTGGLDAPALHGPPPQLRALDGDLSLILDAARARRSMGAEAPDPVTIARAEVRESRGAAVSNRSTVARVGQLVLLMLTMILAGMLLSNLIEEKSNKVIEVLAAAVPVDAIFFGKLIAMLGMSLTGIAVWGGTAVAAALLLMPASAIAALPAPAIGWVAFVALGIVYFAASYLLLGALFLGIGAQASTVREVQTLSMPVTMGQLVVFALASTAVAAPYTALGFAAMIFPWSSPLAMFALAAQDGSIWPHLLAIGWQAIWVAIIIRVAAGLFRRSVLKSGGPRRKKRRLFGRA